MLHPVSQRNEKSPGFKAKWSRFDPQTYSLSGKEIMNDPAAEQRGIYKGNETPQAAGN
jgi:hypothetical protein